MTRAASSILECFDDGTSKITEAVDGIVDCFSASLDNSDRSDSPYTYWLLRNCFPVDTVDEIRKLPFPAPELGGVSGKRELHNATRTYFDAENREKHDVVRAVSDAFQDERVTRKIAADCGTSLSGSYLRIEFAQDTGGFWLEPHTDLGVKLFTMLFYLSNDADHSELGTDIYDADKNHVGRSPFMPNAAMVFVPSDITYHGFEPRPIKGVRKSLIINYVTNEWRAREQLAFPDQPIS